MNSVEQNFAIDLKNLSMVVDYAANILLTGTRSQRRPDLGKMFTCPHCGSRRLQGAPKCCNAEYAKTQRAWTPELGFYQVECPERVHESMFSKSFLRRLRHKKHGQNRTNRLRAFILRLMGDENLLKTAALKMNVKVPARDAIPSFGQKYWLWLEARETKRLRLQRDVSRRVNAGHAKYGTRYESVRPRSGRVSAEKPCLDLLK